MRKFTIPEFIWKSYKTIHNKIVVQFQFREYSDYCKKYQSYRHIKKKSENEVVTEYFYMAARPNPGAGIGHQIANWNAGLWFSELFHVKHAHIPFSGQKRPFKGNEWEEFLGFGEHEITVRELLKQGYKPVLLPLFHENNEAEKDIIMDIMASYSGRKIVFILEQDQFYKAQYGVMKEIRDRFWNAKARQKDKLIFDKDKLNIVIHARRGDIVQNAGGSENPNLAMRYQGLSYFEKVLQQVLAKIKNERVICIYIISQGKKEDYAVFDKYPNVFYCMDMSAIDSFRHMVYADVLITSKSSFSYKPALLNYAGIKICPEKFWHGYPNDKKWVLASEEGKLLSRINEEILKETEIISSMDEDERKI